MAIFSARTLAPFAVLGAEYFARKGMTAAYKKRTGHLPPTADDREVPLAQVLAWALAVALVSASLEVIITRVAVKRDADDSLDSVVVLPS